MLSVLLVVSVGGGGGKVVVLLLLLLLLVGVVRVLCEYGVVWYEVCENLSGLKKEWAVAHPVWAEPAT
jgi:hypothetical protein